MTTLAEFISIGQRHGRANLHIKVPDFQIFYARFGKRWLAGTGYSGVFDIATVEVKEHLRGTGVFTRFFRQLRERYPRMPLYVENAAPRFQRLLLRLNFKPSELNPDCFYFIEGICSEPTYTTGTSGTESGNLSDTGTEIQLVDTGTTTTSSSGSRSEPKNDLRPPDSSECLPLIVRSKRRKPTW